MSRVAIATFFLATLAAATTLGEAFTIYAFVVEAVTIDDAVAGFSGRFIPSHTECAKFFKTPCANLLRCERLRRVCAHYKQFM